MEKESVKTRPEGITLISALFWILAILALVIGLFMVGTRDAFIDTVIEALENQPDITQDTIAQVESILDSAIIGGGVIALIFAILYVITGWGLWTLKSWARIVAMILAVISFIAFPIGTIIGIVVLWYLFKPEIKKAFQ